MSTEWIIGTGVLALGFSGAALLIYRLKQYWVASHDLSAEYDPGSYDAMRRLLNDEDEEFLRSQSATEEELADFRRERRSLLRLYIAELAQDFQSLHARARVLIADAPEQHAELVGSLMSQQFRFWRALAAIEVQLTAEALGIGQADPSGILAAFDSLGVAIARATAVPGPVPV